MVFVLGYEVELVYIAFTLVVLFTALLFALASIFSHRQYRVLKEQIDALAQQAGWGGGATIEANALAQKVSELQKKVDELTENQAQMTDLLGGMKSDEKKIVATEARGMNALQVNLSKKITLVKKLERDAAAHGKKISELKKELAGLKPELRKHEIIPLHAGGGESVGEEVARAFDELMSVESKVNKLAKRVAQAQKKAASAKKLAETEPKKRVSKKVFRKTVRAIKKKIEKTPAAVKKKAKSMPQEKTEPASAQVTISSEAPFEVNVGKKSLF